MACAVPDIPEEFVKKVTLRETLPETSRHVGIFEHKETKLLVKKDIRRYGEHAITVHNLSGTAPTVAQALEAYSLFRQGSANLTAKIVWEA